MQRKSNSRSPPSRSDNSRDSLSVVERTGKPLRMTMQAESEKQRRYSHIGFLAASTVPGKMSQTTHQEPTERRRRAGVTHVQHAPEFTSDGGYEENRVGAITTTVIERNRKKSRGRFLSGADTHPQVVAVLQNVLSDGHVTSSASNDVISGDVMERKASNRSASVVQLGAGEPYTVKDRDTLASIAAGHGGTVSELTKLNKLMSSMIFPGQVLYIPTTRLHNGLTLDGETSSQPSQDIVGGRLKGGQRDASALWESQMATERERDRPNRRVSFYSDVHPDIGQLATEIEQLKKRAGQRRAISSVVRPQLKEVLSEYAKLSMTLSIGKFETDIRPKAAECITDKQLLEAVNRILTPSRILHIFTLPEVCEADEQIKVICGQFQLDPTFLKFSGKSATVDDSTSCSISARLHSLEGATIYVHESAEWKRLDECNPAVVESLKKSINKLNSTNQASMKGVLEKTTSQTMEKRSGDESSPTSSTRPSSSSSLPVHESDTPDLPGSVELQKHIEEANFPEMSLPKMTNTCSPTSSVTDSRDQIQNVRQDNSIERLNRTKPADGRNSYVAGLASGRSLPVIKITNCDDDQTAIHENVRDTSAPSIVDSSDDVFDHNENDLHLTVDKGSERVVPGDNDAEEIETSHDYFYLHVVFSNTAEDVVCRFSPMIQRHNDRHKYDFWFRISYEVVFAMHEALICRAPVAYRQSDFGTVPHHIELNRQNSVLKPQIYQLYVTLREGRDLIPTDRDGLSNPYVKFKFKNKLVHRTQTVYKNTNPRWSETFSIRIISSPITASASYSDANEVTSFHRLPSVRAVVRDHNFAQFDVYMGEGWIELNSLVPNTPTDMKLTLSDMKQRRRSEVNMGYLVLQCILSTTSGDTDRSLQDSSDDFIDPEFLPKLSDESLILEERHIAKLAARLPNQLEGRRWSLCFSADRQGFSLSTLFRRTSQVDDGPSLLVIKDSQLQVFGAFITCSLKQSEHFYGGGESFLYTFYPSFRKFPWTTCDDYFVRGNSEGLVIGGGGGLYGLWLDSDLYRGISRRCNTFNNDPLTSSNDFTVSSVEIWAFE